MKKGIGVMSKLLSVAQITLDLICRTIVRAFDALAVWSSVFQTPTTLDILNRRSYFVAEFLAEPVVRYYYLDTHIGRAV